MRQFTPNRSTPPSPFQSGHHRQTDALLTREASAPRRDLVPLLAAAHSMVVPFALALAAIPATAAGHESPRTGTISDSSEPIGIPVGRLPQAVTSFGAATIDSWVYVLGGYTGPPHDYRTEYQSRAFMRINALDPNHIETLPNDQRVQGAALLAVDHAPVAIGGMTIVSDVTRSIDTVRRFDLDSHRWATLPSLPTPRSSHDAVRFGGLIIVAGGWTLDGDSNSAVWARDLLTFDVEHPDAGWKATPQPFARRALALASVTDRVIAIGGIDEEGDVSSRVDVFEPATGAWSTGPDYPGFGFGVSAFAIGDDVYASGSEGTVHRWRPGESAWSTTANLTFPRFFHRLVPAPDGDLFAIGGIGKAERVAHIERVPVANVSREGEASIHWVIPAPGSAKNRQGVFLVGDALIVTGGNRSLEQHDFGPDDFLDQSFRIELSSLHTQVLADLPARRQSMLALTSGTDRSAWTFGGFGHDGDEARTQAEILRYDVKKDSWTPAGALPVPRSQFGLIEHDGDAWLFGGLDFDPTRAREDRFHHLTSVLRGRLKSQIELETADIQLPRPRRAFACAELGGRVYCVGGMEAGFSLIEPCDVVDLSTGEWSEMASPRRPRLSGQLVVLGDRLHLVGGSSPDADGELAPNPEIEQYDPVSDKWHALSTDLPISPRHLRAFAWRGRLLLYSAHDEANAIHIVLLRPTAPRRDASPSRETPAG